MELSRREFIGSALATAGACLSAAMAVGMAVCVSSAFADDDVWAGRTSHPAVVNPAVPVADGSVLSLRGEWEFASCPNIRCAHMLGFQEATNFLGNAGVWAKSRTIGVPGCWDAQGVGEEGFGVGHDGRSNVTVRRVRGTSASASTAGR